jgi:hypothetical protein
MGADGSYPFGADTGVCQQLLHTRRVKHSQLIRGQSLAMNFIVTCRLQCQQFSSERIGKCNESGMQSLIG